MVTVSDSIWVDAPVERVFEYLDDPHNHVEVTPSLAEVRNVERLDNGGKRVDHTYKMGGVSVEGELVEREREVGELLHFELSGGLTGEITIETELANGGTKLTYSAEYELPGRVLSRAAEPFVRRYNERELRSTLENTKARLESRANDG